MIISFSINHDGEFLVLVDGEVKALAKKCAGFNLIPDVFSKNKDDLKT